MIKTFKQRTLEAQLDLIKRYKENMPPPCCPFCKIYWVANRSSLRKNGVGNCVGCFMSNKDGSIGCHLSPISGNMRAHRMMNYSEKARLERAKFHRKVRKILLKTPARHFTPSGWKRFNIPWNW
jgi:hypothetical protein